MSSVNTNNNGASHFHTRLLLYIFRPVFSKKCYSFVKTNFSDLKVLDGTMDERKINVFILKQTLDDLL